MRVSLKNNAIFVQSSINSLNEEWMEDFFNEHIQNTLFLDNGLLVLNNEKNLDKKTKFLDNLSKEFGKTNELASPFYKRSLKKCKRAAVRIEVPYKKPEKVEIELFAFGPNRVKLTFITPNQWIMRYLKQQLSSLVTSYTSNQIYIDVSSISAKTRLEKALNRREVLHYVINYNYDEEFMSKLYGNFKGWGFNNNEVDKMIRYHAIFDIPVGSKLEDLKKRYRQLAKRYHPDRVNNKSPEIINKYTEKFKLIQEAYGVLKEKTA